MSLRRGKMPQVAFLRHLESTAVSLVRGLGLQKREAQTSQGQEIHRYRVGSLRDPPPPSNESVNVFFKVLQQRFLPQT